MVRYDDLLYPQPSFFEGIGRLMDFAGLLDCYNDSESGDEADQMALMADWFAVGDDLRGVIVDYARRHGIEVVDRGNPATR